jgi:HSP20 family protein
MTLMRPRPYFDTPSLREAMDRLFDRSFVTPGEWMTLARFETPAIDVVSKPEAIVVKVALPGVKPDDIETTITGNTLEIHGTYRDEEKKEEDGYPTGSSAAASSGERSCCRPGSRPMAPRRPSVTAS